MEYSIITQSMILNFIPYKINIMNNSNRLKCCLNFMLRYNFLLFTLFCINNIYANSYNERRSVIYRVDGNEYAVINPGESFNTTLDFEQLKYPTRKFLRVVGKVNMPESFSVRGEGKFREFEYYIDDNLDSTVTFKEKYSLFFKGNNDNFERYAYYRLPGNAFKPGKTKVILPVVKQNMLKISDNGNFGMELGIYFNKQGRNVNDVYDSPDSTIFIPLPEGDINNTKSIERVIDISENLACILIRVGGKHFEGECWLESPQFIQKGVNVCSMPFVRHADRKNDMNYWVGVNMTTRNWPLWSLKINDKEIFRENIFDRASNVADFYIPLPDDINNGDRLELQLIKEKHRASYSYSIRSVELIEESMREFEVISVPKYVAKGERFGILLETNNNNVTLNVKSSNTINTPSQTLFFENPGLHVVEMRADRAGERIDLSFSSNAYKIDTFVTQVIDKLPDNIYLSSGDEIYIDKQYVPYNYFFKWYISHRVGNWYQFRPSYQWSGFRIANDTIIRHYVELLDRMRIPYAWQVEGRTLAGSKINPSLETLDTDMFMGKQAHENDGGYYYWRHFKYNGLYCDMAARARPYGGIFAKHRPIYTDHGTFIHYDPYGVNDMEEGARKFVDNLRYSKGESTRHTGPSTLFRYLYQAGYEWLGAEQMYGPEETILSSLRGASRAYNKKSFGTLHAMQWGSFPYTDPKHALRHYMSLAVAYMHGSSHLNTEEALWVDEYMNDRYSESGKAHLFSQHQMLDYIETHTRRGDIKSNIAVIQGRNDAWKSFDRGLLWSQESDKWKFNKACESFDLLRVFYPKNKLDACGPEGWFTPTPYGTVDLLPVEAPLEVMNKYKAMIFLGWNTFSESDFTHIRDYVFNGGTLLLSAAHINSELEPDKPVRLPANDNVVREMLGNDYRNMKGKNVISYGSGKIIYFASASYPAENDIMKDYEDEMHKLGKMYANEEYSSGWVKNSDNVGFSVWDSSDRRTIFLLNTDWESDAMIHNAELVYGSSSFTIPVRRYNIETVHISHGVAVYGLSNTTDVISITDEGNSWAIKVQTTESDTVSCFNSLTGGQKSFELTGPGIHTLKLNK